VGSLSNFVAFLIRFLTLYKENEISFPGYYVENCVHFFFVSTRECIGVMMAWV